MAELRTNPAKFVKESNGPVKPYFRPFYILFFFAILPVRSYFGRINGKE